MGHKHTTTSTYMLSSTPTAQFPTLHRSGVKAQTAPHKPAVTSPKESSGKGQWRCVDPVSWLSMKVTARPGHHPIRPGGLPLLSRSRQYCLRAESRRKVRQRQSLAARPLAPRSTPSPIYFRQGRPAHACRTASCRMPLVGKSKAHAWLSHPSNQLHRLCRAASCTKSSSEPFLQMGWVFQGNFTSRPPAPQQAVAVNSTLLMPTQPSHPDPSSSMPKWSHHLRSVQNSPTLNASLPVVASTYSLVKRAA